jgi:hypothetical protein
MPVWPAEGSVDVVDGVIVVKIGEFTAQQIITLCHQAPTHDFCERDAQRLLAFAPNVNGIPPIYQGRWSSPPAGSEEGWGLELAHQRDTVFVSWFTYDLAGRDWWLTMSAQRQKPKVYSGTLIETRGPSFAAEFKPSDLISTPVGSGTLTFSDANNATLDYTVKGIRQSKPVTRMLLADLSPCLLGATPKASAIPNYRGLWWAAPAGSESGWGLSLNQRGDSILGTWFTYDLDGRAAVALDDGRQDGAGDVFGRSLSASRRAVRCIRADGRSIDQSGRRHAQFRERRQRDFLICNRWQRDDKSSADESHHPCGRRLGRDQVPMALGASGLGEGSLNRPRVECCGERSVEK